MTSRIKIKDDVVGKKRNGVIELVTVGKTIRVDFTGINDLKKAVKVMEENNINKCDIVIDSEDHVSELSLIDELPYLEELDKKGYDINFCYDHVVFKKFPLKRVIEDEKRLNMAVQELNESNLSPLEKFIALYDIVSFFKPYKEERTNIGEFSKSRCLHQYLDNNYMVCAGYADLLTNLCKRVGIECCYYTLDLVKKEWGHARCYVHLQDPKYGIDGYYISDPTARKIGKTMYYDGNPVSNANSILMTTDEQKLNENIKTVKFGFFELSEKDFIKAAKIYRNDFKKELYNDIKKLDSKFAKRLKRMDFYKEEDVIAAKDYIDNKLNNRVDRRIILNALLQEKRFIFSDEPDYYFDELRFFYSSELQIEELEPEGYMVYNMKIGEIKRVFPEVYGFALFNQINNSLEDDSIEWDPTSENLMLLDVRTEVFHHMIDLTLKGYRLAYLNNEAILLFPHIRQPDKYTLYEYEEMLQAQILEFYNILSLQSYTLKKKN